MAEADGGILRKVGLLSEREARRREKDVRAGGEADGKTDMLRLLLSDGRIAQDFDLLRILIERLEVGEVDVADLATQLRGIRHTLGDVFDRAEVEFIGEYGAEVKYDPAKQTAYSPGVQEGDSVMVARPGVSRGGKMLVNVIVEKPPKD